MSTTDKILLVSAFLMFVSFAVALVRTEYKLGYAEGRESVFRDQTDDSGVLPPYESTPTWKRLGKSNPHKKGH